MLEGVWPPYNRPTRCRAALVVLSMRNPLQEQLLKAGLVKKGKLAEVVREQNRQRKGQGKANSSAPADASIDAGRLRAERVERDRLLAAERNAQARAAELCAQIRQIIEHHRVASEGDSPYRFTDAGVIREVLVDSAQRKQLAKGSLVIVRLGEGHELLPRNAAEKIRERDAEVIVVDHGHAAPAADEEAMDEHYRQFKVPDDLVW